MYPWYTGRIRRVWLLLGKDLSGNTVEQVYKYYINGVYKGESTDSTDELIDKICLEFKCIKDNIDIIKINERYLKDTTKAYLIEKNENDITFNLK